MPSTTDGIVLIAQIHGIGASSTDNLIRLANSSSGIEVAASSAQIVAIIPMEPAAQQGSSVRAMVRTLGRSAVSRELARTTYSAWCRILVSCR